MATNYNIHRHGDVVCLTFDPQTIHEQAGRRPSIMESPRAYKEKVGLEPFCPVTSKRTGHPYGAEILLGQTIGGMILSDQLKNLDWRVRKPGHLFRLPADTTTQCPAKIPTSAG